MMFPRLSVPFVLLAVSVRLGAASAPAGPVSFNRDIRPIMSDTCFHCHGFDAKSREAGMRLDLREEALKPTKNGVIPIVPGKPEESEVIFRINDTVEPMPPEEAHKTLTPAQKELFRRWIAEGAVYEPHWAYAALKKPPLPAAPAAGPGNAHPIDRFIRSRLAEKGIPPSPPAEPARLFRRLSLDLTGLPPTPGELAAFTAEAARDLDAALLRHTERLLASPRHGERLAVWWLDVARYADTVGFHGDQNQRIFPYRDYVIGAFNANKRFDQFTIEQLAGDLLPKPTTEQLVATGYNRLNMMTREGGAQAKEYLAKYGAERVRSVAAAWFGSTFGCAECHDHKFDPIKTADFYQLQAFFADVKQWGVYSDYRYTPNPDLKGFTNDHPFPPELEVTSPYLVARRERLQAELTAERAALGRRVDGPDAAAFTAWLAEARAFLAREPSGWQQPPATAARYRGREPVRDGQVRPAEDGSFRLEKPLARTDALRLTLAAAPGRIAALRLEITGPRSGPPVDDTDESFDQIRLAAAVRGADGRERKVDFVFAAATAAVDRYEQGEEVIGIVSGWRIPRAPADGRPAGTWLPATPLVLADGEAVELTLTGAPTRPFRVLTSPFGAGDPREVASAEVRAALAASSGQPAAGARALLAETWLLSTAHDPAAFGRHHRLRERIRETRGGRAWTLVTEAVEPLTMRVLPRGNWQDESGPVVLPATPSFLPGRRESTPERRLTRLDLARWIVSEENPITARVVMNRMWALFFGTGLSAAVDDLGSQGELPSHPELLDWLAAEFRDGGWDLRHMIRLIVTSATYRQSSRVRPELRETDPANRLLAAQNPRRLEAEFVRDNALFIAGALDLRDVGGPSVKPYQPAGYYAQLQFPDREYVASDADEQWRRGLYMHWQRTFLHPMLANFDAPARDECAAQRVVSNTPQQALTLLNDPTFVEAARLFAARIAAAGATDAERLRQAFLLALAREPRPAERASLERFLATQREHYRSDVDAARKLLRVGIAPAPAGDPTELAAWTSVARVILNGQEVITRY